MKVLELRNISLGYCAGHSCSAVVENLNLCLLRGEILAVIGRSGSGKSTLLSALAGLRDAAGGPTILGGEISQAPGTRTGLVFQAYMTAVFPWLTIVNNVALGHRFAGLGRSEAIRLALQQLSRMGLDGFADSFPSSLSGGMLQRVQLARVLGYGPDIWLLDEPFGSLDALTRQALQKEFLCIWENIKSSAIVVTHDILEALYLSDRILVLGGRPSTIVYEVAVPLSRPRPQISALLRNLEFQELLDRLTEALE